MSSVKQTRNLLSEVQQKLGNMLAEMKPELDEINQHYDVDPQFLLDQKLQLVIGGHVNSGKTSLVNELFKGEMELPSPELPYTSRWVHIVYSEEPYMQIIDTGIRITNQLSRKNVKQEIGFVPATSVLPVTKMDNLYNYSSDQNWKSYFHIEEKSQGRIMSTVKDFNPVSLHLPPFDEEINLQEHSREDLSKLCSYVRIGIPSQQLRHGLEIVDSPGLGENEFLDRLYGEVMRSTFLDPYLLIYVYDSRVSFRSKDIEYLNHYWKGVKSYRYKMPHSSTSLPIPTVLVANKIDLDIHGAKSDSYCSIQTQPINFDKAKTLRTLRQCYQYRFPESDLCEISTRTIKSIRLHDTLPLPEKTTDLHLKCFKALENTIAEKINKFSWLFYQRLVYLISYIVRNFSVTDNKLFFLKCLSHISEIEQLFVSPSFFSVLQNFDLQLGELLVSPALRLDNTSSIYDMEIDNTKVEIAVHKLSEPWWIFNKYLFTLFNFDYDNFITQPIAKYYNSATQTFYLMFLKPERRLFDQLPRLEMDFTEKYIHELWQISTSLNSWDVTPLSFVLDPNQWIIVDSCLFSATMVVVLSYDRVIELHSYNTGYDRNTYTSQHEQVFGMCAWMLLDGSGSTVPVLPNRSDPKVFSMPPTIDSKSSCAYHRPVTEWPDYLKRVLNIIWTTRYFLDDSDIKKMDKLMKPCEAENTNIITVNTMDSKVS